MVPIVLLVVFHWLLWKGNNIATLMQKCWFSFFFFSHQKKREKKKENINVICHSSFLVLSMKLNNLPFTDTNSGKSVQSSVRGWLTRPLSNPHIVEYAAKLTVPHDFGCPGAILLTNLHSKEFYLLEIVIHGFDGGPIFFPANTWIHSRKDNPESRIIFKNQVRTV
jgi:hypothetical protein